MTLLGSRPLQKSIRHKTTIKLRGCYGHCKKKSWQNRFEHSTLLILLLYFLYQYAFKKVYILTLPTFVIYAQNIYLSF